MFTCASAGVVSCNELLAQWWELYQLFLVVMVTEYPMRSQVNRIVCHPTLPVTITAHEDRHIRFFDNNSGKNCVTMLFVCLIELLCVPHWAASFPSSPIKWCFCFRLFVGLLVYLSLASSYCIFVKFLDKQEYVQCHQWNTASVPLPHWMQLWNIQP